MGHAVARDLSPCTSHTHVHEHTHIHTYGPRSGPGERKRRRANGGGNSDSTQTDGGDGGATTGRLRLDAMKDACGLVLIGWVLMDDGWDMAGRMDRIDVHTASISIIILSVLPYLLPRFTFTSHKVRSTEY